MAAAVLEGTDTVSESRFLQERQGRQGLLLVSVEHSIRRNSLEDSVAVVSIEPVALAVMAAIVVGSIWHSSQRSSTVQKFIMLQALVGQQQLAELVSDSMQHRRIRLGSHHYNLEHYQRKFHWIVAVHLHCVLRQLAQHGTIRDQGALHEHQLGLRGQMHGRLSDQHGQSLDAHTSLARMQQVNSNLEKLLHSMAHGQHSRISLGVRILGAEHNSLHSIHRVLGVQHSSWHSIIRALVSGSTLHHGNHSLHSIPQLDGLHRHDQGAHLHMELQHR